MTLLSTVLAQQTVNLVPTDGAFSDLATTDIGLETVISWAINAVLVVAALAFFFMLILGGIRWILSGGDKANTESARNQVTAAIIGLVIVFSAWIILTVVFGLFGINATTFTLGTLSGST